MDKKTGAHKYDLAAKTNQEGTKYNIDQMQWGHEYRTYENAWGRKGALVEPFVSGFILVKGRHVVREPVFPWDSASCAAGFSDPCKSILLKLGELHRIKTSPVKGAGAGRGQMVAQAVRTLDVGVLRVRLDGGLMGAGLMVPGARVAPGGLGSAMMGGMSPLKADAALLGCRRDRPRLAATRDRVEQHIGLQ